MTCSIFYSAIKEAFINTCYISSIAEKAISKKAHVKRSSKKFQRTSNSYNLHQRILILLLASSSFIVEGGSEKEMQRLNGEPATSSVSPPQSSFCKGNIFNDTETSVMLEIPVPSQLRKPINAPDKLLMGPGPSNVSPRVLEASALPVLGHLHPEFVQVMDDIKAGLQYIFQTKNPWTVCIPGPGHLGMEAMIMNILERGEKILVGVHGVWGIRVSDVATRLGLEVHQIKTELGKSFTLNEIEEGLQRSQPKVLYLVHSESSTGVMQNLEGVGELCRKYNCLLAVDTVASLCGVPFFTDKWGIDAVYTGSQKVIGAPPGMAPISFSPRAVEVIKNRKTPVQSFLLDMNHLANYWNCNGDGKPRAYHHTAPVNLFYSLREALSILSAEKLENVWNRHSETINRFHNGLRELGLEFFVEDPSERLPTVTTIKIPSSVRDWKILTQYAMDKYLVEISGGLGDTMGKVWRVGVMGYNAYPGKIDKTLQAIREGLEYAKLHGRL